MNLNATLIIEVLSFLILLAVLTRLLYRPVLKILDKRAAEIEQANQNIQENLAAAEKGRQQAAQILADSKATALQIQEKVALQAEQARQKIVKQAKAEAAKVLHSCQQDIAAQTEQAKEQIKGQAVELSLQVAEKILRRKFGPEDQRRLIKEFAEQME